MLNRDVISILLLSFYLIDVKSENKNHRVFSMINLCDVALLFDLPSPENDRSNFLRLDSFVATGNRKGDRDFAWKWRFVARISAFASWFSIQDFLFKKNFKVKSNAHINQSQGLKNCHC